MKIIVQEGHRLLAACDIGILGKEYKDGDLHIKVKDSFYNDEQVDDETFLRFLRTVDMLNLVGEHVVGLAVKEGFIDEACILKIDGVPHAQMCHY